MSMRLARIEASSMSEALEKIRAVYGDEGLIVGTRTVRRRGMLGVGAREVVEVYVADTRERAAQLQRKARMRAEEDTSRLEPDFDLLSAELQELREEMRDLLTRSVEGGGFRHPFLRECFELLESRGVDLRFADYVVREIANHPMPAGYPTPQRVAKVVAAQLARLFPPVPPPGQERPRTVVLVGPTGVGKTTTIAKLAARARLHESRGVALVTLDTFRIAAVDQLARYAEIIGVPLEVVASPDELGARVEELAAAGAELVFVDTAGRSQRDELKMNELESFLRELPRAEIHLVASTTLEPRTFENVLERFKGTGYDRLILTKCDESLGLGPLAEPLVRCGAPVAYLTDGQNVPDDIQSCDPERLADLVVQDAVE